ncbi:MAG: hypothetical protein HY023_08825, partial [Chloroflexi bacterium]|nr:hypothetical protein [Chloroflexota bacterium]
LFIATALPWLYPPREPLPEAPTLADLARSEIPPALVGTTTVGEYTPQWVRQWPDTAALRAEQVMGREPERLDAASLPKGAIFVVITRNPRQVTYLLNVPSDASVVYRTFFFPGWEGELDGDPLTLRPTEPEGLISFKVPSGQHVVSLRFADTPIRRAGQAISLIALVVLIGVISVQLSVFSRQLLVAIRHPSPVARHSPPVTRHASSRTACRLVPVGRITFHAPLFIASLFIVKLALLDTALLPIVQHGLPGSKFRGEKPVLADDFGDELTLLGYDLSKAAIGAGDSTVLDLYWTAQRNLGVPYGFGVRLSDERGLTWSKPDIERPRDFRFFPGTDNWPTGQYVLDPYIIRPVPGTPPGLYVLEVVAYRQSDLQAIGTARIGTVEITSPFNRPIGGTAAKASFGDGLVLPLYQFDRVTAAPGDQVLITLTWQASAPIATDRHARLDLIAQDSDRAAFSREFTIIERYPTSRWKPRDVLTDQILLRLPATLSSNTYQWYLTALDPAGRQVGERTLLIPHIGDQPHPEGFTVMAPARTFTLPPIAHAVSADLGDSIALRGYDLSAETLHPGERFTVTLVWQAR